MVMLTVVNRQGRVKASPSLFMARIPIERRFGERVRALRQEAGLSQEELALRLKLSRTYLSQLEAGRRNVSLRTAERIAHGLGVPLAELVKE